MTILNLTAEPSECGALQDYTGHTLMKPSPLKILKILLKVKAASSQDKTGIAPPALIDTLLLTHSSHRVPWDPWNTSLLAHSLLRAHTLVILLPQNFLPFLPGLTFLTSTKSLKSHFLNEVFRKFKLFNAMNDV